MKIKDGLIQLSRFGGACVMALGFVFRLCVLVVMIYPMSVNAQQPDNIESFNKKSRNKKPLNKKIQHQLIMVAKNQCAISPQAAYQQLLHQSAYHTPLAASPKKHIAKKPKQYRNSTLSANKHQLVLIKININTASAAEFTQLPYIGAKKAQAIIKYRNQHGSFKQIYDLTKVKGIGIKTVQKLAHQLTIQ